MHVAVESGAKNNQTFLQYVDYLVDNNYTPPNSKTWVDKIRKLGNDANHEITIMSAQQAKDVIKFLEYLLKFRYEFPESVSEEEVGVEEKEVA
jgi:hypothetical protein